jgi:virulence-associated protein VapD
MSVQDRSITYVTEESVMTTQLLRRPSGLPSAEESDAITSKEGRVYAIAFDMDIESLKNNYGDPYNNAYYEIRRVLQKHGFTWQQGSVYFGGEQINAVTCVLAAMDLARSLPWFAASVRDIRMLRIEELNDLMPAVQQAQT